MKFAVLALLGLLAVASAQDKKASDPTATVRLCDLIARVRTAARGLACSARRH
jgi:hypothetical protein